jgi:hypothetical protein
MKDRIDRIDGRAGVPAVPSLRLWLPGYHTPSLNVTKGGHWGQYHGLKQQAAKALLDVLKERSDVPVKVLMVVDAIAQGGKLGKRGELIRAAAKQEAERTRKAAKTDADRSVRAPVVLSFTRVTCQPLDVENHCGSTKALTDCLRLAFPAWLPDDAPEFVEIVHKQTKCAKRCEEGTWVELRLACGEKDET